MQTPEGRARNQKTVLEPEGKLMTCNRK